MATETEITAGANALQSYINSMLEANDEAWEELFIPDSAYTQGATDAITAADAATDQSAAGRLAAATAALQSALDTAGYGSQVSAADIQQGAQAILSAVATIRNPSNPTV